MESHQLEELARELRAQGYPQSYIARLRDELCDHLATALEEGQTSERAHAQLGDGATLATAVADFPILKSWPQRFPLATFVILPGFLLSAFTVTFVFTAARLAQDGLFASTAWNQFAIRHFGLASVWITTILAAWLCVLAIRARMQFSYLAASLLLVAANGLFVIDLAQCAESGGCLAHSRFGIDITRLSIPIGLLAVTSCFLFGRERLPWPAVARVLAAVLLCLTVFAVSSKVAVEQVRRHPADNLIEGLNSEPRRAYLMMELLDAPEALSDLGCDPSQAAEVRQLVEGWSLFSAGAMQAWQTEHPDFRGFGQFERRVLQPYLIETQQGVDRLLRPEQQMKLQQQVYYELGWRALFLFEVSRELGLSGKQRRELKDVLLREVRERETPAPCPTSRILNERQRRQLASMQGVQDGGR